MMKAPANYLVKVVCTGFSVLMLLLLPLFWSRWFCEDNRFEILQSLDNYEVSLTPSELVPRELEYDPNVVTHSYVQAEVSFGNMILSLGIWDYFLSRMPGGRNSYIYDWYNYDSDSEDWTGVYFDEDSGQIVKSYRFYDRSPSVSSDILRIVERHAGPEGLSSTPDTRNGRFNSPIVDYSGDVVTLYDKMQRCFFKIDFREETVVKGPQLAKDAPYKPVAIGEIYKNPNIVSLSWSPPLVSNIPQEDVEEQQYSRAGISSERTPIVRNIFSSLQFQYTLVLDETGRIDLFNKDTLEFVGTAGYLPAPRTLFPSKKNITSKDLLDYEMLPLALSSDGQYRGLYVGALNREGTAAALTVFDENGMHVSAQGRRSTNGRVGNTINSRIDAYFDAPWLPALTIAKYLTENLHPPILSVISYYTADSFEAGSGHRGIFLLPNSFIAMKGRDVSQNFAEKLIIAFLLILPSIILAILLAWRVNKDALVVGLSDNTRLLWTLGTVAFGLAGYITYRLCRPTIRLVTCSNCGKPRRPDMERCHRCKSGWHVPELIPPAWRVVD